MRSTCLCKLGQKEPGRARFMFSVVSEDSPSFAPVVMATSVSGFKGRLKSWEYTSAIAFLRLGFP